MSKLTLAELFQIRLEAIGKQADGVFHCIRLRDSRNPDLILKAIRMADKDFSASIALMKAYHLLGGDDLMDWEAKVGRRLSSAQDEAKKRLEALGYE